jgi:hypothetical protein
MVNMRFAEFLSESKIVKSNAFFHLISAIAPDSTVRFHPRSSAREIYVSITPVCYAQWNDLENCVLHLDGTRREQNAIYANLVSPKEITAFTDTRIPKEKKLSRIVLNLEELDVEEPTIEILKLGKKKILKELLQNIKNASSHLYLSTSFRFYLLQVKELQKIANWPELEIIKKSLELDINQRQDS